MSFTATTDPYYVAKEEVEAALKRVQDMVSEWKRLLRAENTARCARFQELHAEISGELVNLDLDLKDITATINMVEDHRDNPKFNYVSAGEITSRKEFVKASLAVVREIQDSVSGRSAQAKIEADKRQVLQGSSSRSGGQAHDRRAEKDNEDFLARQRQDQQRIIQNQDETLNDISKSALRLGEAAKTINMELQDQQQMLEDLDKDVDRETEKLNFVMKRMGRLLQTGDSKQLCLIIGLFVLMVVLIFLIINS
jgi:hypothetical protein